MKYSRGFLAITAVLVLGVCLVVVRSGRATEPPPSHDDRAAAASPPSAPGPAELAALRQEVAQLRQAVKNQAPAPAPAEPTRTGPPDPEIKALETQAEQERRHRDYVQGVAASYRNEPVDPAWSSAKLSVIQAALASKPELRSLVRGMECRSQTCRVEFADDASGRPSNALQTFTLGLGTELPGAIIERVEADGGRPGSTAFYVGHSSGIQVTVQ